MILRDGQLICGLKSQVKQKAQNRKIVFNRAVAKKTEIVLVGIFILQIFNLIFLWLYLFDSCHFFGNLFNQ